MINKFINLISEVILLHILFCDKKVKLAEYSVKLAYFKLLRKLTYKYKNKNDKIEFLNRYKKQNKNRFFNKCMIKSFLYYGIFPTLVLYALHHFINLNNFILIITTILMVRACIYDIIVCYRLNQLNILRNAIAELAKNSVSDTP